ncbi:MAG TPA: class I SAM-dependent methyltransferase [Candidatus Binataceae bacterium]|nr:class I SAM-dependent methyltransferase [Candidatus Binataceae bacterium]
MSEWFDDDSFWQNFEGWMFSPERIADARAEVERMVALLGIAGGARVLDLCCGVGRHSLEFARRGFLVTGVDRTRSYLEKARTAAAKEKLVIEFVESDMREFARPDTFDGAINFFTAFGYFDDPDDELKVARNLCASLNPGGRLLIDLVGKEIIARDFRPRDFNRRGDVIMLEERRLLDGWKRLDCKWTLIRGDERHESTLSLRLYSGAEVETLLRSAGFTKVELYGGLSAKPYDQSAQRLIAVATK